MHGSAPGGGVRRQCVQRAARAQVPTRYWRMQRNAARCGALLRTHAGTLALRRASRCCSGLPWQGRGRRFGVRQRASKPHYSAVSCFRSSSADPFRTLPREGSSMGAGRRCAAVGWTAERLPLSAKVPTRYTPGASCWCDRPAEGRRSVRRRSARPGSTSRRSGSRVVRDGRVVAVGSSGQSNGDCGPGGSRNRPRARSPAVVEERDIRRASRAGPLRPWTRWRDAARYCIRSDSAAARGGVRRGVVTDRPGRHRGR
jgi:hypothetical protein